MAAAHSPERQQEQLQKEERERQFAISSGASYLGLLTATAWDIRILLKLRAHELIPGQLDFMYSVLHPIAEDLLGNERPSQLIRKALNDYTNYSFKKLGLGKDSEIKDSFGNLSGNAKVELNTRRGEIIVETISFEVLEKIFQKLHELKLLLPEVESREWRPTSDMPLERRTPDGKPLAPTRKQTIGL